MAPSNYSKLRGVNHLFYNLFVGSAGDKKLYEIYLHVAKQICWTTHVFPKRPGGLELSNKEHSEILTAFEKAEQKKLQILIEEHWYKLQEQLVEAIKREKTTEIS